MDKPNRTVAFLAYLFPILGWAFIFLFQRRDRFALYHACQSLGLTFVLVAAPLVWLVIAWVLAWIPFAGPVLSTALFALVAAAYIVAAIAWIVGMVNALSARVSPIPVFGGWGEQAYEVLSNEG